MKGNEEREAKERMKTGAIKDSEGRKKDLIEKEKRTII